MNALSRLIRWRDGDIGSETVMDDIQVLGRIGSQLWAEIQRRGVDRNGKGKAGHAKPLTRSHIGFLAGRSSDYAMDYLAGHRPAEAVWQTLTEYAQTIASMIADREGKAQPPMALRMMIPDCETIRERELIA